MQLPQHIYSIYFIFLCMCLLVHLEDLPIQQWGAVFGHFLWEINEGPDGHDSPQRQEIWETMDLSDLHWVWLLYNTNTHTNTATLAHIVTQAFFLCPEPLFVCVDQTCEDATCPFSGMLTLQAQTKLCAALFGISQHSLPARIAFTNTYYGGDNPQTHRILYVNGETGFATDKITTFTASDWT